MTYSMLFHYIMIQELCIGKLNQTEYAPLITDPPPTNSTTFLTYVRGGKTRMTVGYAGGGEAGGSETGRGGKSGGGDAGGSEEGGGKTGGGVAGGGEAIGGETGGGET